MTTNPEDKIVGASPISILEKVGTMCEHTDHKAATNHKQTANRIKSLNQNQQQNGATIGNKVETVFTFSMLVGLQRNIIIFMCHECKNTRSKITNLLTIQYIATSLKCSAGSTKTSIQRLVHKGFLIRTEFKNGRGGSTRYELPDAIYHDALRNETNTKLASQLTTSTISSSSNIIRTTTNTDDWNFDITPYKKFGFTSAQLKQLSSCNFISAIEVEQSLIEFNYDLENNTLPIIKTNNINFLIRTDYLITTKTHTSQLQLRKLPNEQHRPP